MTDNVKTPDLKITDPHNVRTEFANDIAGIGFLNGVVNVTFTQARWTPESLNATQFPIDSIVVGRVRFDLNVAQNLHHLLGQIIEQNTKPNTLNS
jgi:hypothetical protein